METRDITITVTSTDGADIYHILTEAVLAFKGLSHAAMIDIHICPLEGREKVEGATTELAI